jgi:hypothetical protein
MKHLAALLCVAWWDVTRRFLLGIAPLKNLIYNAAGCIAKNFS